MHTSIEAGHFYLYPDDKGEPCGFTEEQQLGIRLALEWLAQTRLSAQFILFIDDFHGHPSLDAEWTNEEIAQLLESHPDVMAAVDMLQGFGHNPLVVSELQLTTAAAHLYNSLIERDAVSKGKKNLLPIFGGVPLVTADGQPTCSLIDSALYLRKIGISRNEPTVTVLPIRYQSQQYQVRHVLAALGIGQPPITIIYHDETGRVVKIDEWSQE